MTSGHPHPPSADGSAPGYRAIRWNMDWINRPLFGIALAVMAIWVSFLPPGFFDCLAVAITIPAAYEWHRLVGTGRSYRVETAVTVMVVALAVTAWFFTHQTWPSLLLLVVGTIAALMLARAGSQKSLWQALGVIYLGLPVLALVGLRGFDPHGARVIVGLFLIVWATDTGALIFGKLIGGPRMAPRISPSKTWAGTIGGSVTAAFVFACYIWILGGAFGAAALFALFFSSTAHAGDLFESFVKRRFGKKDSGALIPGHGGVLDRMDSTLFSSVALIILIYMTGFNPLFGVAQ